MKIYIPHWLDSMENDIYNFIQLANIYIPHWLDSMIIRKTTYRQYADIYIPHWLDSMGQALPVLPGAVRFTFHTG